jgi:hypothetical protein
MDPHWWVGAVIRSMASFGMRQMLDEEIRYGSRQAEVLYARVLC